MGYPVALSTRMLRRFEYGVLRYRPDIGMSAL